MKKDGWSGPCKHHLNLLSWRQSLADVVEIGLDDNGLLDIETLRSQLDLYKAAKRPMLVLFLLVVMSLEFIQIQDQLQDFFTNMLCML